MITRWEDTPRCMKASCRMAPLSAVDVKVLLTGPNEKVAEADMCAVCGSVGKIRMNLDAVKKYGTSYDKIAGLLRQSKMGVYTPEELKSGRMPGATRAEAREAEEVLRPVTVNYDPDKYISSKHEQEDLL
jgi:hypothetical protein